MDSPDRFYLLVYTKKKVLQAVLEGRFSIAVWNKLYKTTLWQKIRFPVNHEYEDHICLSVIDQATRISVFQDFLYFHRKRSGSITMVPTLKRLRDWLHGRKYLETFVEQHTPEIFSTKQMISIKQKTVIGMIGIYAQSAQTHSEDIELIRKEVLDKARAIPRISFRAKSSYQLLRLCPKMLITLYPIYCNLYYYCRTWKHMSIMKNNSR